MKLLLFISLLLLGLPTTQAQTLPAPVQAPQATEEYCQVEARPKLNGRYVVSIDYGQRRKLISLNLFRDEQGNAVEFNSAMDALNWLNTQGWELASSFVLVSEGSSAACYVMRRRLPAAGR